MRVRFLINKRYPHPDGKRRLAGDVVEVEDDLAQTWLERGIVEDAKSAAESEGADPLSQQPSGDLRQSTAQTTVPQGQNVVNTDAGSSAAPQDYEAYAEMNADDVVAKVKSGEWDRETVLTLENTRAKGPRSTVVNGLKEENPPAE